MCVCIYIYIYIYIYTYKDELGLALSFHSCVNLLTTPRALVAFWLLRKFTYLGNIQISTGIIKLPLIQIQIFDNYKNRFANRYTAIVLVSNQRDAAFVLLGLLSLYMFRARFASIFRSNTQNCNGSHQCVSMRAR